MKYGGSKDTFVQFLFYQPIRYQWRETEFFPCSVTCGGGEGTVSFAKPVNMLLDVGIIILLS